MKKNYTDITIVLDRSGSMDGIKNDTIGGFNKFIEDQKNVPGEATFTLVQFDDQYEVVHNAVDLQKAPKLTTSTFVPRGMTALLDAIGRTINNTGSRLEKMKEENRPQMVVFAILTDGEENSSREFTTDKIKSMIEHQRNKYNWQFVFLGANQDACFTAKNYGININSSMTFAANNVGTQCVYASLSRGIAQYRSGNCNTVTFSSEDRQKQAEAGV